MGEKLTYDAAVKDEKWLPVPGFEDCYLVSKGGQVKSVARARTSGGLLKQYVDYKGRPTVGLSRNGSVSKRRVAHLVAEAFLGDRPSGMVLRHLNDNPADNRVVNLAYGTHSDNRYDSVRNGVHPMTRRAACTQGHEFTPENTYFRPSRPTVRVCRECKRKGRT